MFNDQLTHRGIAAAAPPRRRRARWYTAGLAGLTGVASIAAFSGAAAGAEASGANAGNPPSTANQNQQLIPCAADQLIAAIVSANANGGAQLTLTPRCTYTLTTNQGADGLPIITQPITINGQDATITRAASATNFRILNVGVGGRLTLNNLTITGGFAPDSPGGGGILVQAGGQATLHNTTVTRNQSTSDGGGIANYGITAVLGDDNGKDSKTTSATAQSLSRVSNNNAQDLGGGISNEGQLTVRNVEVSYNTSEDEGGGLFDGKAAVIDRARIDHNTSASEGGGITSTEAVTKITDSSVSDNTATAGGGIFCVGCTLYVSGTTVDRNTVTGNDGGGGVYALFLPALTPVASAVIEDSEVNGNTATSGNGGGIRNLRSNVVVRRSQVSLNRATGTASQAGGISNEGGRLTLTAARVTANLSTVAPGGIATNNNLVTVDQNSVIVANRPTNCTGSTNAVPNCFG
ncbi:right-handed parallel beta-helix repeat-containing protein [Rugosimonospora africana]|uniref:Polymorphic outer membrane protein n=1 Tax=Rugosimonospora africana TaxID=556532 RepID=A0A8J3R044_9ACTN|nr:right-handed parallel beta-helix repeat-containing protein [Rugosimonospora africana]GIH19217.1 hypothetical protein Raf01_73890 [Rugosimonospora africana]